MPTYKLCYFNARGLAEMIRLLLAEANAEYEDYRIDNWIEDKPKMPFNTVPVLYVDGEAIGNSRAIVRYLAKELSIDQGSALDFARIDMWIEYFLESTAKLLPVFAETDKALKAQVVDKVKVELDAKVKKLEDFVKINGGPYVFGKKFTSFDVVLFAVLNHAEDTYNIKFDSKAYPHINGVLKSVGTRPNIAKWLIERPKTQF